MRGTMVEASARQASHIAFVFMKQASIKARLLLMALELNLRSRIHSRALIRKGLGEYSQEHWESVQGTHEEQGRGNWETKKGMGPRDYLFDR